MDRLGKVAVPAMIVIALLALAVGACDGTNTGNAGNTGGTTTGGPPAGLGTYRGTLTTKLQLQANGQAVNFTSPDYDVVVTLDAPKVAQGGTRENNPMHLEISSPQFPMGDNTHTGSIRVTSSGWTAASGPTAGGVVVVQYWVLKGTPSQFSGTLDIGGALTGANNMVDAAEYGGPFGLLPGVQPTNTWQPCIVYMSQGARMVGALSSNGTLMIDISGLGAGECMGGLASPIPFDSHITASKG